MQSITEWFYTKIRQTPHCWIWTGCKTKAGYGRLKIMNVKSRLAHRLSYKLYYGSIPAGYFVLHTCDNRACVSPYHLKLGTAQDNANDVKLKGRLRRPKNVNLTKSATSSGQSPDSLTD